MSGLETVGPSKSNLPKKVIGELIRDSVLSQMIMLSGLAALVYIGIAAIKKTKRCNRRLNMKLKTRPAR
ncbi:MAG: hypothetical protein ACJAXW_002016 [Candidatus Azotimanducaceae bacterium]